MNILWHFAQHLEFCGLGALPADAPGDLFWGRMPDQPDAAACVFSADSGKPGPDGEAKLQILVRGASVREAYERSQRIADAVDGFDGFLHGDGPEAKINVLTASEGLGPDAKGREMFRSVVRARWGND